MARIDLWTDLYPVPPEVVRSRTLSAPGCPDFPITLRQMDEIITGECVDRGQRYIGTYVDGEDGNPPQAVALPKLGAVRLSKYLCNVVATLETMQVPDEGDAPYSLVDWLLLAKRYPKLWKQVLGLMDEVQRADSGDYDDAGNSAAAGTGGSSSLPAATSTPTRS